MRCSQGKCELVNNNICCKVCSNLQECMDNWSKECNGEGFEKYCLCTNFDLSCEYISQ